MLDVDLAIVGAGGAGLSVLAAYADELDRLAVGGRSPGAPLRIALCDPALAGGPPRTWCFWAPDPGRLAPVVHRAWALAEVVSRTGEPLPLDLSPLRYWMIRSDDFAAHAMAAADRLGVVRCGVAVRAIEPDGAAGRVLLHTSGDPALIAARWVLDSRPPPAGAPPARPARTALLQHFEGWTVRLPARRGPARPGTEALGTGRLEPERVTLMDFTVRQPAQDGLAFGYVLPLAEDRALVEHTVISREPLPPGEYATALREYLSRRFGLVPHPGADRAGPAADRAGPAADPVDTLPVEVLEVERGAIPMTDAGYAGIARNLTSGGNADRGGGRVVQIGTAGGATRGSSGYTFAAMQRTARVIAGQLAAGLPPDPPRPYPRRHRWLDAVLLRALDRGQVDGAELFCALFARHPTERVLRFLDGQSRVPEEMAIVLGVPRLARAGLVRAALGDGLARFGGLASFDGLSRFAGLNGRDPLARRGGRERRPR